MRIETLQPSGDTLTTDELTIDVAVCVRDERNVPVPRAQVKWMVHGHAHRFDHAVTTADDAGVSRNRVALGAASALARGTICVQTPDSHIYQVGAFFVTAAGSHGAGTLIFHPSAAQLVASPPASQPVAPTGSGNTLTIFFPLGDQKLFWGVPQYAWVRYQDSAGNPLPNQTLIPRGDGAVYIDPADPKPTTDKSGWATVKIQLTSALADNPPFVAQDATGNLYVQAQNTPADQGQFPITFSTTMGGRGYLTATPGTSPVQGEWWPMSITYRLADGTPAKHKALHWTNLSGLPGSLIPVAYSTVGQNPPNAYFASTTTSYTDEAGQSTVYILTGDGYSGPVNIGLMVTSANVLMAPGDAIQPAVVSVARRSTPVSIWPTLTPNTGLSARPPGQQVAVKLSLTRRVAEMEGRNVTWGSVDGRVKFSSLTTPVSQGISQNWITGLLTDALYNATFYVDTGYPSNAPERAYFTMLFTTGNPAFMNSRPMQMGPDPYTPLPANTVQVLTAQYWDGNVGQREYVRWFADPPDHVAFNPPYPTDMSSSTGKALVAMQTNDLSADTRIAIRAEAYNRFSGQYDSASNVYTFVVKVDETEKIVVNPISPPPVLYSPSTVTATYTKGKNGVPGASVQWTGQPKNDPQAQLVFSPDISTTDANGVATTHMTAYGPNQAGDFTVFASSYNGTTKETVAGSLPVSIAAAQTPPDTNTARLDVLSPEGITLYGLHWHVLQARYVYDNGSPVTGKRQVAWSAGRSGAQLKEDTTWTDENGVTTNFVHGPGTYNGGMIQATIQVSAVNPQTSQQDSGQISLVMTANNIEPASKVMTISVDGTQPIQSGYACPISVKYTEPDLKDPVVGAAITWSVYPYVEDSAQPKYELSFGEGNPTQTGADGVSHNTITYNGTSDLEGVILVVSAFNPVTGQTDFAKYSLNFTYVSSLTGIMIDRPWATNPAFGGVDPSVPCQVITAKMTLADAQGAGTIQLIPTPASPAIQIFYPDGTEIAPEENVFTVQTTGGSAEVLVSARYPSFFSLQAYYPPGTQQPVCSTQLWPTQLGGSYGTVVYPLIIQDLDTSTTPPQLKIPGTSTWPNPVFTASIPPNGGNLNLNSDDDVVILLNYRIAYTGKVADAQSPNSVDIAYAMLQPTGNAMSYVVGTGRILSQRGYFQFDAPGQAQINPAPDSTPTLIAPSLLIPDVESIQATDVVDGLRVRILPTATTPGWTYQAGDEITVYFYLSGKYPLPSKATRQCPSISEPIRNIASLQYTVVAGDELTSGQAKILGPLPQAYLAGYGSPGTLRMNFKMVRPGSGNPQTYWSKTTSTLPIDTASLDPVQ
ncbi:hypothetical protein AKI39_04575 [Bordetella sp. H567]|uniref:hypothetical protein n=1 Tax=Bordetella sp. H567 TaxID=1697043 RepID=UPI00081C7870|nr:hypothetical protein [Bordetella sp. H567]AOB30121.1 hypothetical protein AKI39_04575 [Bordetella sp. H567]